MLNKTGSLNYKA